MSELMAAMQQMLVMIAIIAVGVVATKRDLLDEEMLPKVTRLLIYVALPCMILGSASALERNPEGHQLAWTLGLSVLLMAISVLGTFAFNAIFRTPRRERVLYLFMSVCTNMGFIGISVVAGVFGDGAVLSASIFVFVSNISIFSLGFMILDSGRPKGASLRPKSPKEAVRALKPLVNPATVACVLAVAVYALGVPIPGFVQSVLGSIGGITAPMAMLLVGVIVSGLRPAEIARGARIYAFIAFRQLLVPVVTVAALAPFAPDATALRVFAVMAAMPVGSMAPMLVTQFDYDSTLVAKATVLSTVLSFAIVPLLLVFVTVWT